MIMGAAVGFTVTGSKDMTRLARSLTRASHDLLPSLMQEAAEALEPLKPAIRRSAMDTLPTKGGVDRKIADSDMKTTTRPNLVRLETRNAYALRKIDEGVLRHPVPNTNKWVDQPVPRGWWSRPVTAFMPRIVRDVQRQMQRLVSRIGR